MVDGQGLFVAKGSQDLYLLPRMANRHGLIAGATGTGKTFTLKVLAEAFSSIGVPVFLSDIKGDLAGICEYGESNPKLAERLQRLGLPLPEFQAFPVRFWDVFGELGHPVRTTISEMGPLLIARLLNLNETQTGVLNITFKIADDQGLLILDLKDLRSMLVYIAENASQYTVEYGNISRQTIGAIQRGLLTLEEQGADQFFGEPALEISDLMRTDSAGLGFVNILAAERLVRSPALYATFLLWLLAELFEELPEVGDLEKPKMVFFFDEAHLLFNEAPKVLLDKIEQVVRLIRSKGVGVYFITQNPLDIPDVVLGQLGNRVQHALRAFTPRDQRAVKAAAETFRPNPSLNVEQAITELGVGEALVSFLDKDGRPSIVERAFVAAPRSLFGTISPETRQQVINKSLLAGKYDRLRDRESAYELLQKRYAEREEQEREAEKQKQEQALRTERDSERGRQGKKTKKEPDSVFDKMAKSAMSSIGTQIGREIARGVFGSLLRKR